MRCSFPIKVSFWEICFHTGKHTPVRESSDVDWQEGEQEYENLWASQNAEDLANKFTTDGIYINEKLGILRGREGKGTPN